MVRAWAVYDVFLGNPVLVERCTTKERALRVAELQALPSGAARYVVEQLLPDSPSRPSSRHWKRKSAGGGLSNGADQ